MTPPDYEVFELGNVVLQSGLTLRNGQLAYKTYGRLDPSRANVILYPPPTARNTTTPNG